MSEAFTAPSPLLIMGSPRSGTTFLAQMVNRFFDIQISRDNGTLMRFHRILPRYEPLTDDGNMKRLIHALYDDHFFKTRLIARGLRLTEAELFNRIPERTYGALIETIFSAIAEVHGKRTWGYKRASFGRVQGHHIDELFPRARFVHIIRDARDVALSMRNTPRVLLERSWHFAARDWVSHVETGRRIGRQLGPDRYLEVRYERLMSEPEALLTEIMMFAGPGPDGEQRLARIRQEIVALIKSGNSEKWRRLMPPAAVRTVERVAGPLLLELGYPVAYPHVAGQRIGTLELGWLHADRIVRNLFTRNIAMMIRYRLEVLKAHRRARSSKPVEDAAAQASSVR
jgi:hypothetical protein